MTATLAPVKLVTTPQINFINDLKVGRDRAQLNEVDLNTLEELEAGVFVDRALASSLIDGLKAIKKESKKTPAILPGIYVAPNGDVIQVKQSKGSDRVYAKVMVDINSTRLTLQDEIVSFDFTYAPGLISHITPEMRMTAEQASAFGLKTEHCIWCGKPLKVGKSVLAGMGPRCAKRFV